MTAHGRQSALDRIALARRERFPLASHYHPDWILASSSGGANALWLDRRRAVAPDTLLRATG